MSTEVLEAIPESGNRSDTISSMTSGAYGSLTAATSCGLSPPVNMMLSGVAVVGAGDDSAAGTISGGSLSSQVTGSGSGGLGRKRHHSSSKSAGQVKRRRKTYERNGPKPKFLLGGSITDPLNLNSLADEEISKIANATPAASPLEDIKEPDTVIVPQDYKDPLKLNSVSDNEDSSSSLTRTICPRKLSGKKKKSRSSEGKCESVEDTVTNADSSETSLSVRPLRLELQNNKANNRNSKITDKIVSPVLPDSRSRKRKARSEPSSRLAKALLIDNIEPQLSVKETETKRQRKSPEVGWRFRRQHSHESKLSKQKPKFKEQDKKFQYGNYSRYYGYRNPDSDDGRIGLFKREWFHGKKCLDIGCNTGHVTLAVAKAFEPTKIVGLDIDGNLIGVARKNVKHCLQDQFLDRTGKGKSQFPISMEKTYGPLAIPSTAEAVSSKVIECPVKPSFPANVLFRCANFVLEDDALLSTQKEEFDTILCLSVTKWVHLNWGDAGMKRFFQRIFRALYPGGRLILEPQAWPSYRKKRKMTETTFQHYEQIVFKPHLFKEYLLSKEVGFASCEVIGTPLNKSKGFRRPILMFTKLQAGSRPVSQPPSPERVSTTTSDSAQGSQALSRRQQQERNRDSSSRDHRGRHEMRSSRSSWDWHGRRSREGKIPERKKSHTSSRAGTSSRLAQGGTDAQKKRRVSREHGHDAMALKDKGGKDEGGKDEEGKDKGGNDEEKNEEGKDKGGKDEEKNEEGKDKEGKGEGKDEKGKAKSEKSIDTNDNLPPDEMTKAADEIKDHVMPKEGMKSTKETKRNHGDIGSLPPGGIIQQAQDKPRGEPTIDAASPEESVMATEEQSTVEGEVHLQN
ncbi:7SK snRNA methylphosphate capping enzyme-like [Diadema antillarum]|uniref:7SK snRNA methylphosphate capping enzyme-like n=1 Tax=Diadema antillarum TaxID=105358 RepID=UPI003A84B5DE